MLEQVKGPSFFVWQEEGAYKKGVGMQKKENIGYALLNGLFHKFAFSQTADVQPGQKLLEYIMKKAQENAMSILLQCQLLRF